MHALVSRGIMPEQMSYSGRNFDVLTGASAIVVAALVAAGVAGRRLVMAWNIAGLRCSSTSWWWRSSRRRALPRSDPIASTCSSTYPPFVWLPAVLVLAALAGHLIIFRAVRP